MYWPINEGVKLALGVIGNITAVVMFSVPLKTVFTIIKRRSSEDFSVVPYAMTLASTLLWTFYGLPFIGEGRVLVISVNAIGAGLQCFYVTVFFVFNSPRQRVRTCIYTSTAVTFFGTVAAITVTAFHTSESRTMFLGIVNVVYSVAVYSSPLEIMCLVVRTKSVKYMPFFLSLLVLVCSTAWTAYAVYVRDIFIAIPNGAGMLLGMVQLLLYAIYHRIEVVSESMRQDAEAGQSGADSKGPALGNDLKGSDVRMELGGEKDDGRCGGG